MIFHKAKLTLIKRQKFQSSTNILICSEVINNLYTSIQYINLLLLGVVQKKFMSDLLNDANRSSFPAPLSASR